MGLWICTGFNPDIPFKLPFYLKQGFKPFKRSVYICQDHRLTGHLAMDAAPHVPIIS